MTDHPVTPPPELLEQWEAEVAHTTKDEIWHVAVQAARWGADRELEACIKLLSDFGGDGEMIRRHRRQKPKSLAEEALGDFEDIASLLMQNRLPCNTGRIRRALERLQELEGQGDD